MSITNCMRNMAFGASLLIVSAVVAAPPAQAAEGAISNEPSAGNAESTGAVPDTGGGLFGFIAFGLWHVYRNFPSSGRCDWLLLFCLLAALVYAVFWPLLWKAVAADMRILAERRIEQEYQGVVPWFWSVGCLSFLLWFFHTTAGKTFFVSREWFGLGPLEEVNRPLFWISFVWHLLFYVAGSDARLEFVEKKRRLLAAGKPQPSADRGLLNLYLGGGIFYTSQSKISCGWDYLIMIWFVIWVFHVFYWYWSAASVILMLAVSSAAILNELIRMLFVYILHKRTFG